MPSLLIDVEARYAKFRDGMAAVTREAERGAGRIRKALSVLGTLGAGFSVAGLVASVKSYADQADELGKLSQRIGVSVEALSALKYAGDLADVSLDQLGTGVKQLSKNMLDASRGSKELREIFAALDVSTVDAATGALRATDDVLLDLADRFAAMPDSAEKTAVAMKLLGRSGADLIPLLNAGSSGLRAAADEARRFGLTITTEGAKAAEEFNDNLTRINKRVEGLTISLGNQFLPVLANIADAMANSESSTTAFTGALRLLQTILETVVVVGANIGYVFNAAGREIGGIAAQLAALAKGDLRQFREIGRLMREDAEAARREIDAFSARVIEGPTDPQQKTPGPFGGVKPRASLLPRLAAAGGGERDQAFERSLRALERAASEEQKLLAERLQILEQYNAAGLLSLRQYYDGRAQLQADALERMTAAFDAEESALRRQIAAAPAKDRAALEEKLSGVIERRADAEREAANTATRAWFEQQQAAQQYDDQLQEITARLAEMRGETEVAVMIRFDVQNADIIRRLRAEAEDAGADAASRARAQQALGELESLRALTEQRERANALQEEAADILRRLDISERRLSADREAGAVTELDMLGQLGQVRGASLQQLEQIGQALRELAISSGDKRLFTEAEEFDARLQELTASTDVLGKKFESVFTDSFGNAFASVIDGTKSVKDAFNDMASSIVQAINRIIAQEIATSLFKGIFGGGGGKSGGSSFIGDFIGSLFSARGNAFSVAGPVAAFASGGAFGLGEVLTQPTVFRFASGGSWRTGVAGEAGPEGALPLKRMPDGKLGVYADGAGGVTVQINVQGVQDEGTLRRSAAGVAAAAARAVSRGRRNN